jgi:hypothetical protein
VPLLPNHYLLDFGVGVLLGEEDAVAAEVSVSVGKRW